MSRSARLVAPQAIHHVISRFVNKEFRMAAVREREAYLERIARALKGTDWTVLGYALMSSHVHLACQAGNAPSSSLIQPLNTGFGLWLNRTQRRLGPVFAGRHTTVLFGDAGLLDLETYLHNNVVRARVVSDPAESDWTSHRALLGLDAAPPWLDVERVLSLCGFDSTPTSRANFHDYVKARAGNPRDPSLSDDSETMRRQLRAALGAAIEVASPEVTSDGGRQVRIVGPQHTMLRPRWGGPPEAVIALVARHCAVRVDDLRSGSREQELVAARRLALLTWTMCLGGDQKSMALTLGLSPSAASKLLRENEKAMVELAPEAQVLGEMCWQAQAQLRKAQ